MSNLKKFVSVAGKDANMAKMDECAICGWVIRTDKKPFDYKKGANQGTDNSKLVFTCSRTEQYKDKEGNWKNENHTSWFRVLAWGVKADELNDILQHNMKIRFTFRFEDRQYETKDGQKGSIAEFTIKDFTNIVFVGKNVDLEKFASENNLRYFAGSVDTTVDPF